jgi:hypothetical protein
MKLGTAVQYTTRSLMHAAYNHSTLLVQIFSGRFVLRLTKTGYSVFYQRLQWHEYKFKGKSETL